MLSLTTIMNVNVKNNSRWNERFVIVAPRLRIGIHHQTLCNSLTVASLTSSVRILFPTVNRHCRNVYLAGSFRRKQTRQKFQSVRIYMCPSCLTSKVRKLEPLTALQLTAHNTTLISFFFNNFFNKRPNNDPQLHPPIILILELTNTR